VADKKLWGKEKWVGIPGIVLETMEEKRLNW
jgi:hypothetical protein